MAYVRDYPPRRWMEKAMSMWQIDSGNNSGDSGTAQQSADVPLKWAHDAQTNEPRYIHDNQVVSRECTCVCPACSLSLTPVMAGQPLRTHPTAHFRHPPGAQKESCTLVSAHLAATHHLAENGYIELPRRTMSRSATGFSGEGYEVWVEVPAERRVVKHARLLDRVTAELTLDDGRKLLVDLTGHRAPLDTCDGQAIVTIALSDPELAMLGPEEIRSRLRILPDVRWCAHWNDAALASEGDAMASQAACDALDNWTSEDEAEFISYLTPDIGDELARQLRRETLLHREVKAILAREMRISTPSLEVMVRREAPDEFIGEWEAEALRMTWISVPQVLQLEEVRLERRLGRIVPDVIGTVGSRQACIRGLMDIWIDGDFEEESEDPHHPAWPRTLLVEVTVTHGIDDTKLERIRDHDLPTLEIALRQLGGRITFENLRDLVVNQTVGKRWVHHPLFVVKRRQLNAAIDRHPVTLQYHERLVELRRPVWLSRPASYWGQCYLEAARAFHDANVIIRRARRQHQGDGKKPALLGADSEMWVEILKTAEALAAHDLPGAADPIMLDESGLVARLLSIQLNTGVGYDVRSGYQVLNAIMQSGKDSKRWDTLYAIAVKVYRLEAGFTEEQASRYAAWRENLIANVDANEETYMRPVSFDAVLSVLFPEMAERIKNGYGLLVSQYS